MSDTTQPGADQPLVLEPPVAVATVAPQRAVDAVPLNAADKAGLNAKVGGVVDALTQLDVHGDDFRSSVEQVVSMGNADVARSAGGSNSFLERPARELAGGTGADVGKSLLALRRVCENLDPSGKGLLGGPRKLLGIIPMGNALVDYFHSYESSQKQIDAIMNALYHGRDALLRDNAAIEEEKVRIWSLMTTLGKFAFLAGQIDDSLSSKIETIKTSDPERAKILQEEVLFRLRQHRQDITTQMAVNVQAYLSLDLIRKNNVELVAGVNRATTTTIMALRTAVTIASALASQKLVLDQISALTSTTNKLILGNSGMLRDNSAEITKMSTQPTVAVETLKTAFDNIFQAIDATDSYRIAALAAMKQTVDGLQEQIDRSKTYTDRQRAESTRDDRAALPLLNLEV